LLRKTNEGEISSGSRKVILRHKEGWWKKYQWELFQFKWGSDDNSKFQAHNKWPTKRLQWLKREMTLLIHFNSEDVPHYPEQATINTP
jgi:hypothetical protein